MFSLIRSCKVEELSRNWQDIHHEQRGKYFRSLRKETWVWYTEIWLDRKLKLFFFHYMYYFAGDNYWQIRDILELDPASLSSGLQSPHMLIVS